MPAKEAFFGCLAIVFSSNLARLVWATALHILGIVLTVINLAIATSSPKEALSWARFDLDHQSGRCHYNMGLLKLQQCCESSGCVTETIESIRNPDGNFLEAGRGVIAADTFAMVFGLISVIILWLWIADKADKLRFPRIILQISNFLSLTLYIVAISTYYKLSYNQIKNVIALDTENTSRNIAPGYAIAIGIVVIVCSFFAWAFTFWRVCRPNKNEPAREKKVKTPKATDLPAASSTSALDTAKAQQQQDADVEGQAEPGEYEAPASSRGGYGGNYGGAYSNGNAYSNNDNSSYGNNESAYGGNSNSAYGNSGGAYSQKESAYGY